MTYFLSSLLCPVAIHLHPPCADALILRAGVHRGVPGWLRGWQRNLPRLPAAPLGGPHRSCTGMRNFPYALVTFFKPFIQYAYLLYSGPHVQACKEPLRRTIRCIHNSRY